MVKLIRTLTDQQDLKSLKNNLFGNREVSRENMKI